MAYISDEEDPEIWAKLRARSTEELVHLRESAIRMNTPRAQAIRFMLISVMLERHMAIRNEPTFMEELKSL